MLGWTPLLCELDHIRTLREVEMLIFPGARGGLPAGWDDHL